MITPTTLSVMAQIGKADGDLTVMHRETQAQEIFF